jgi:hypothetical protein
VTIGAADIVPPMLATPKVVAFFFAGMARETRLRNLFGRFVFERDDLLRVTFFEVGFAWAMTLFAAGNFSFPTANLGKLGMTGVRERFELVLVAILAGFAADILSGAVGCWSSLARLDRL